MGSHVQVGNAIFGGEQLPLIAGPCVIESQDHSLKMAEKIKKITDKNNISLIYKSSFDKANRTSVDSFRGPNIQEGLEVLAKVKSEIGVPVITDVHLPNQAKVVAEVVDIIQIPAFLCRQTDLLIQAGKTGKTVNIKKGQFLPPEKIAFASEKIAKTGNNNILLTERGATFGYGGLVVDMCSIPIMRKSAGYPVIFDATHSAQRTGGSSKTTGGLRQYIPTMAKAAVAAGCDGIFMEVHDNPDLAKSDAATQWPLNKLDELLSTLIRIHEALTF